MRMEQLRYFAEVAKSHSMVSTAERLYVTQPAISTAIRNLESEWGVILFKRSKNGMFLTELGEVILQKVQIILNAEKSIRDAIAESHTLLKEEPEGFLRVCSVPMVNHAYLRRAVPRFTNAYPRIRLSVLDYPPGKVIANVLADGCDVGLFLVSEPMLEQYGQPELVIEQLSTEKIYAVADKAFQLERLCRKQSVSFGDLKDMPLSTTNFSDTNSIQKNDVFDDATEMNIVLMTDNIELLTSHILAGESIGILFNAMVAAIPEFKSLDVLPVNMPYKGKICCAYRVDNPNEHLRKLFLETLQMVF